MNSHFFAGLSAGDKNVLPGFIRLFRWAAVLALSCLMAGSAPAMNLKGPLTTGGGDVCTVQPQRGMAAIGHIVHNAGPGSLTIMDVSILGAENLEMTTAESFKLAAGSSANIVVALDTGSAKQGTSRALRIVYEQNSTEFAANASSAMTVAGRCF